VHGVEVANLPIITPRRKAECSSITPYPMQKRTAPAELTLQRPPDEEAAMRVTDISNNSNVCTKIQEDLIEEFLPLIKRLAYKMARRFGTDHILSDLISAGIIGLLEVVGRYDPTKGAKLNSFAYLRIKGAMIDELRSKDWFPRSVRAKALRIQKVTSKLEGMLGRHPDEEEVAREMNMDPDSYRSMLRSCDNLSMVSIEDVRDAVEESRDRIIGCALDRDGDPEKYAELCEMKEILKEELKKLSERERMILIRYYRDDANMAEIGKALGITEARVSQIHAQLIADLRPSMSRRFKEEQLK
jgi:RNA polymerase sigma factor for flagellar operon FliA